MMVDEKEVQERGQDAPNSICDESELFSLDSDPNFGSLSIDSDPNLTSDPNFGPLSIEFKTNCNYNNLQYKTN